MDTEPIRAGQTGEEAIRSRLVGDEAMLLRRMRHGRDTETRVKAASSLAILERVKRRLQERGIEIRASGPEQRKATVGYPVVRLEPAVGLPTAYSDPAHPNPQATTVGVTVRGRFLTYYDASDPGSQYDVCGVGEIYERMSPGCADDSLKRQTDQFCYWAHLDEDSIPLARRGVNSTWFTDRKGVNFTLDPVNTTMGRDVVKAIQAGIVQECSFGFWADDVEWDDHPSGAAIRICHRITMTEGTICHAGAYRSSRCWIDSGDNRMSASDRREMAEIQSRIAAAESREGPPPAARVVNRVVPRPKWGPSILQ